MRGEAPESATERAVYLCGEAREITHKFWESSAWVDPLAGRPGCFSLPVFRTLTRTLLW